MFNFFSSTTPDSIAIVAAFLAGVSVMVFGAAAWYGISNAVKQLMKPSSEMARRNR